MNTRTLTFTPSNGATDPGSFEHVLTCWRNSPTTLDAISAFAKVSASPGSPAFSRASLTIISVLQASIPGYLLEGSGAGGALAGAGGVSGGCGALTGCSAGCGAGCCGAGCGAGCGG